MKISQRPAKPKFKAFTDVVPFGKHKGHTIEWVLDNDAAYLVWALSAEICTASREIEESAAEIAYAEEMDDYFRDDGLDLYDFMAD